MNEPEMPKKFFGDQVPPVTFWALLALCVVSLALGWHVLLVMASAGLALGTYFVWASKHGGSGRLIRYPDSVSKRSRRAP